MTKRTKLIIQVACTLLAFQAGRVYGETPQESLRRQLDLSSQAVDRAHQIASQFKLYIKKKADMPRYKKLHTAKKDLILPSAPERVKPESHGAISRPIPDGSEKK